uniref:Uncharacterized protein n=1 Tax=Pipistrellus kuhlii TaxID=59472 RepID=A0A7J7ZJC4_PIPKU|nr:hypothetical protein mPipKuh1_009596 [Pipistrellus kuhlii]
MHYLCVSGTLLDALLSTLNREVSSLARIAPLRKGGVRIQSKVNETQKPIQILSTSPAGVIICVCALSWAVMVPVFPFLLFFLLFILCFLLSSSPSSYFSSFLSLRVTSPPSSFSLMLLLLLLPPLPPPLQILLLFIYLICLFL